MEWSNVAKQRSLSLPDQLSVQIERMILSGDLAHGEKLPSEPELAEHLNVSRSSIRQALRELEHVGLISRSRGRGTIVVAPGSERGDAGRSLANLGVSGSELERIMELRAVIEPPIAALAATRTSPRDVEQLRLLIEEMEREEDLERYADLDRSFHQAISQYSHNPLLAQLTDLVSSEIAPSRRRTLQSPQRRRSSNAAHRAIYEAIAERHPDAAHRAARLHVETVLEQARAMSSDEDE